VPQCKRGSYPFRFGGSVKAAIAEAGGKGHPTEQLSVAMLDFITAEERVRQLKANRPVLPVRKARIEAPQQDGREYFEVPQPFGTNS
jgi:polysaccharide biosynthesis/export protein